MLPPAPLSPPGCPASPRRRSLGFTLIELLIVISVVALVAALALPTISKVREMGLSAKCVGNLRNISTGLYAYIADNNGALPLCAALPSDRYQKSTFWFDALNPYMGYPELAPNRKTAFPAATATGTEFPIPWQLCPAKKITPLERQSVGYGWNSLNFGLDLTRAETTGFGANIRQLTDLGRTIIIADSMDAKEGVDENAFKNRYIYDYSKESRYPYPERHSGQANYLFLDGHIEAYRPVFLKTQKAIDLFKQKRP